MPTHVAGRETVQDPVRLKNMLAEAERRLVDDGGMRRPDAAEILKPGHLLVDDTDFWRHQSTGLAVFLALGVYRSHRVPLDFAEAVLVNDRVHVKPMQTLLDDDGRVFLLDLSLSRLAERRVGKGGVVQRRARGARGIVKKIRRTKK